MDDGQIISSLWLRSEGAIAEVQNKYGVLCLRLASNIIGNRADAEECVNDAMLSVWNTIPPQRPGSLCAYICAITRNIALNRYRYNTAKQRDARTTVSIDELYDCIADAGGSGNRLLSDAINAFLASLNPLNRTLFLRRYYFEDSITEIAKMSGLSENAVHQRLYKLRLKFRKHLISEGVIHE